MQGRFHTFHTKALMYTRLSFHNYEGYEVYKVWCALPLYVQRFSVAVGMYVNNPDNGFNGCGDVREQH
ncbi:unnamed protein product [Arctogadus glacialis]